MSNAQKIERLAVEVMGWTGIVLETMPKDWNPLADWNHWRQVEEKVMEDTELANIFLWPDPHSMQQYIEADLPTRVDSLIAALDSLKA